MHIHNSRKTLTAIILSLLFLLTISTLILALNHKRTSHQSNVTTLNETKEDETEKIDDSEEKANAITKSNTLKSKLNMQTPPVIGKSSNEAEKYEAKIVFNVPKFQLENLNNELKEQISKYIQNLDIKRNNFWSIDTLRSEDGWGLVGISENYGGEVLEGKNETGILNTYVLAYKQIDNKYEFATNNSKNISDIINSIPNSKLSLSSKQALFPSTSDKYTILNDDDSKYKFPWDKTHTFHITNSSWHGVAVTSWGVQQNHALDFDVNDGNSNAEIISAAAGTIYYYCTGDSTNPQSMISIKTKDSNDIMAYYHIQESDLLANLSRDGDTLGIGDEIPQGFVLGKMVEGDVNQTGGCAMHSEGTHVHLVFPRKPLTIESKTFSANSVPSGQTLNSTNEMFDDETIRLHQRYVFDVDGDGDSDLIGFGNSGTWVSYNNSGSFGAINRILDQFGAYQGWNSQIHDRYVFDIDGDSDGDLIGFGGSGTWVSYNNNGDFSSISRVIEQFGYNQGWRKELHDRYIFDVDGDGDGDLIGFGGNGTWVSYNNAGDFNNFTKLISQFGYDQGWRKELHDRYVFDIDGDGDGDLIGFGGNGTWVSYNNSVSFGNFTKVTSQFGYDQGWREDLHVRYINDIDGDGDADLIGFGGNGTWVSYNNAGSFSTMSKIISQFCYDQNWRVEKNKRYIKDLDGDGDSDLIGFGNSGTYVSYNNSGSFTAMSKVINQFGYNQNWNNDDTDRLVSDIDGDSDMDFLGFGYSGTYLSINSSGIFPMPSRIIEQFGYDQGWR